MVKENIPSLVYGFACAVNDGSLKEADIYNAANLIQGLITKDIVQLSSWEGMALMPLKNISKENTEFFYGAAYAIALLFIVSMSDVKAVASKIAEIVLSYVASKNLNIVEI
jgi:hypothetical protein